MPGLVEVVALISADVVEKLAAGNRAPLVDGQIVIGTARREENVAAPRIVFIPQGFRYGPPSPGHNFEPLAPTNPLVPGQAIRSYGMRAMGSGYSALTTTVTISAPDVLGGTQATARAYVTAGGHVAAVIPTNVGTGYTSPPTVTIIGSGTGAEAFARLGATPGARTFATSRPFLTCWHKFSVECWGVTSVGGEPSPDDDLDYDASQELADQVLATCQKIAAGVHTEAGGDWLDAASGATSIDRVGRACKFTLEIATPVLREPIVPDIEYAPADTQANVTRFIVPADGGPPEQDLP